MDNFGNINANYLGLLSAKLISCNWKLETLAVSVYEILHGLKNVIFYFSFRQSIFQMLVNVVLQKVYSVNNNINGHVYQRKKYYFL